MGLQTRQASHTIFGLFFGSLLLPHVQSQILCGQYQNVTDTSGQYTISTNQWGKDSSGSQCIDVNATSTPSFSATWSWTANGSVVHSFPNVNLNNELLPVELSNLSTLTISTDWVMYPEYSVGTSAVSKFDTSGLSNIAAKANVALDMFMDADPDKSTTTTEPSHELMIWFGTIGEVIPIGYDAGPVGSHRLSGTEYSLYRGANANFQTVFTWLPPKNTTKLVSKDLTQLIHFLWVHNFIDNSMYLGIVQFGTETLHSDGENVTFVAKDIEMEMEKGKPDISWSAGGRVEAWKDFWTFGVVLLVTIAVGSGI